MIFNSIEFLFFLPVVFALYWALARFRQIQNLFVVAASYVFYGWWNWKFLLLIAFATSVSYAGGLLLHRFRSRRFVSRLILTLGATACLAVLCTFKYFDFFSANLSSLLLLFGIRLDPLTLGLVLPVGISFYTLQSLGYMFDVYRGRIAPARDAVAFFAFISFFPQLVAGPIERASNLLPQFLRPRRFSYPDAVDGMRRILWGLFKKMVVADNCAKAVNAIFDSYQSLGGGMLVWGAVFFAFQIYGDFSGYSDIAIGVARLFGIRLSKNFHFPYLSRNVAEFWRRWHISLNTWFVDYVYIPLGGSRGTLRLTIFNTLVIFLLSGFWHGANWTFICWGAFNALLFIPLILTGRKGKTDSGVVADKSRLPRLSEALQLLLTFALVTLGWIFFRAETIGQAFGYIARIFTRFSFEFPWSYKRSVVSILILFGVEWIQRRREHGLEIPAEGVWRCRAIRWGAYYAVFLLILFWADTPEDFIYFQF